MNFDFLEFMKSSNQSEDHEPTEVQTFEATKEERGKGLENTVTVEDRENAQEILGQLEEARQVLGHARLMNRNNSTYDVFKHAEKVLSDFYINEAHLPPERAEEVSKKMARLCKVVEELDKLINDNVEKYSRADIIPNRSQIWEEVNKILRARLEKIKLDPAQTEVILEDLYKKKSEWIWETKRKSKPLPEKLSKELM